VNSRTVSFNRKARHDYHIEESIEAGIVLTGTEIKSIREGKVSIREAYARPEGDEVWLLGANIALYQAGSHYNHEPGRPRKLLLHRDQIDSLKSRVEEKGFTIVPIRLYLKNGIAKIELGLAKGKKAYDKRQFIAKREAEREMERAMKRR